MNTIQIRQSFDIPKVWGSERIIVREEKYAGKYLNLNGGCRSSIHKHLKAETFLVTKGIVLLEFFALNGNDDIYKTNQRILLTNDIVDIPSWMIHRFTGIEDSVILEFSEADEESVRYSTSEVIAPEEFENILKNL